MIIDIDLNNVFCKDGKWYYYEKETDQFYELFFKKQKEVN